MSKEADELSPNTKTVRIVSKQNKATAGRKTTTPGPRKTRKQQAETIEERFPAVRPEAKYVSDSGQEYLIEKNSIGQFWIKRYKGGNVNDVLKGVFTSRQGAEQTLIGYLRHSDKLNRAWWPGKENARMDLPYGPSQRE